MTGRSNDQTAQLVSIKQGHFVFVSRRHADTYITTSPDPAVNSELGRQIAEFADDTVEVVVGPEKDGIILSHCVAYHLGKLLSRQVLAVYAEKEGDGFVFRREFASLVAGRKVLIVDDGITTGRTLLKTVEAVRALGGQVLGVAVVWHRGEVGKEEIGNVPWLFPLMKVRLRDWPEEECPLCKEGVPINTDIGHGREFLARRVQQ